MPRMTLAVLAAAIIALVSPVQANPVFDVAAQAAYGETSHYTPSRHAKSRAAVASDAVILGRRPSGCPRRFCGCEASLYLFGKIVPYLNVAANWARKFPRATPAPGMAAARPGHVFVLVSHVSGNDWVVHDGNSGGGYTRRHVRSIIGYRIVDPHGNRLASLN